MSQEIDDMVKAIKQKTEELGAGMTITLAPLTSDAEKLALEIGRYRSHVGQITDADAAAREITKQRGEVMNQLRQLDDNINRITGIITFFWAEARDQVGRLIHAGMTQNEIEALAEVPEVVKRINLEALVPDRLRGKKAT